mgnify:CR=1 FL=1
MKTGSRIIKNHKFLVFKLEKKENNKQKRPLKLSSAGRLQIRRNLGPGKSSRNKQNEKGKTIQIVFRNKNNQRQTSSTARSNPRGSSLSRPQFTTNLAHSNQFASKGNKNFNQKNKKNAELKKAQAKKTTLKPLNNSGEKMSLIFLPKTFDWGNPQIVSMALFHTFTLPSGVITRTPRVMLSTTLSLYTLS